MYYNDGVGPNPPLSPDVRPMLATDMHVHSPAIPGDFEIRLTVRDDDGGFVEIVIPVSP